MTICPKCSYQRTSADTAPSWQCPSCGVAYSKVAPRASDPPPRPVAAQVASRPLPVHAPAPRPGFGGIWRLMFFFLVLLGIANVLLSWRAHLLTPVLANMHKPLLTGDAQVLATADDDIRHGVYQNAIAALKPLADAGNAVAQQRLGFIYLQSRPGTESYPLAMTLLHQAATQGNTMAEVELGFAAEVGLGNVPKDLGEAARWYRSAAEAGDCHGYAGMAWLYAGGEGVQQNYVAAYMMLQLAANAYNSDPGCVPNEAWLPRYRLGRNPFVSDAIANNPRDLANINDQHTALAAVADMMGMESVMSRADIATAKNMAAGWKPGDALPY